MVRQPSYLQYFHQPHQCLHCQWRQRVLDPVACSASWTGHMGRYPHTPQGIGLGQQLTLPIPLPQYTSGRRKQGVVRRVRLHWHLSVCTHSQSGKCLGRQKQADSRSATFVTPTPLSLAMVVGQRRQPSQIKGASSLLQLLRATRAIEEFLVSPTFNVQKKTGACNFILSSSFSRQPLPTLPHLPIFLASSRSPHLVVGSILSHNINWHTLISHQFLFFNPIELMFETAPCRMHKPQKRILYPSG
jgi:hypothetical protein